MVVNWTLIVSVSVAVSFWLSFCSLLSFTSSRLRFDVDLDLDVVGCPSGFELDIAGVTVTVVVALVCFKCFSKSWSSPSPIR